MNTLQADTPLQFVKGVGPRKAEALQTLGLRTVADLLEYFPFRYETDLGEVEIAALRPGMTATVRGEVVRVRRNYPNFQAEISDATGECVLRWFNQPYAGQGIARGATVIASGKVSEFEGQPQIVQPTVQVFASDGLALKQGSGARQVGVYRANAHIGSPAIRRLVQTLLQQRELPVAEFVPAALLARHGFPTRALAVRQMHAPADDGALETARRRLAYESFLLLELALALRRRRTAALHDGRRLPVTPEIDRRIRARFPFSFTAAQDKVVREIAADLGSGHAMTRLLQGDVGSGKTVVALYACLVAVAGGAQAAIMAPTEILAQQHFGNIEKYLAGSRARRALLVGGLNRASRGATLTAIERGEIDLVVGTQALLEQDVAFKSLALVVVDEQHKFGVLQRASIRTKGPLPHYLVMTATPIPRTLAMTVFGDLDASILDASPPGRGKIVTKVVTGRQWPTVMAYVRQRLQTGEQAYVVCPLIGDEAEGRGGRPPSDPVRKGLVSQAHEYPSTWRADLQEGPPESQANDRRRLQSPEPNRPRAAELQSAIQTFERLRDGPWRGLNIGLLHGGMKSAEKKAAIDAFGSGKLQALVSTTVVEVGVDVPTATIMVVEHAERFGLSQLHQLRGRIGRGPRDSLCVLVAYAGGNVRGKAAERLAVLAQTTDGFKIAEADLRQRGPGELLGTRQHGLPELRVGDLLGDFDLLEEARREAFELVARDPQLRAADHTLLLAAMRRFWGQKLALIEAG